MSVGEDYLAVVTDEQRARLQELEARQQQLRQLCEAALREDEAHRHIFQQLEEHNYTASSTTNSFAGSGAGALGTRTVSSIYPRAAGTTAAAATATGMLGNRGGDAAAGGEDGEPADDLLTGEVRSFRDPNSATRASSTGSISAPAPTFLSGGTAGTSNLLRPAMTRLDSTQRPPVYSSLSETRGTRTKSSNLPPPPPPIATASPPYLRALPIPTRDVLYGPNRRPQIGSPAITRTPPRQTSPAGFTRAPLSPGPDARHPRSNSPTPPKEAPAIPHWWRRVMNSAERQRQSPPPLRSPVAVSIEEPLMSHRLPSVHAISSPTRDGARGRSRRSYSHSVPLVDDAAARSGRYFAPTSSPPPPPPPTRTPDARLSPHQVRYGRTPKSFREGGSASRRYSRVEMPPPPREAVSVQFKSSSAVHVSSLLSPSKEGGGSRVIPPPAPSPERDAGRRTSPLFASRYSMSASSLRSAPPLPPPPSAAPPPAPTWDGSEDAAGSATVSKNMAHWSREMRGKSSVVSTTLERSRDHAVSSSSASTRLNRDRGSSGALRSTWDEIQSQHSTSSTRARVSRVDDSAFNAAEKGHSPGHGYEQQRHMPPPAPAREDDDNLDRWETSSLTPSLRRVEEQQLRRYFTDGTLQQQQAGASVSGRRGEKDRYGSFTPNSVPVRSVRGSTNIPPPPPPLSTVSVPAQERVPSHSRYSVETFVSVGRRDQSLWEEEAGHLTSRNNRDDGVMQSSSSARLRPSDAPPPPPPPESAGRQRKPSQHPYAEEATPSSTGDRHRPPRPTSTASSAGAPAVLLSGLRGGPHGPMAASTGLNSSRNSAYGREEAVPFPSQETGHDAMDYFDLGPEKEVLLSLLKEIKRPAEVGAGAEADAEAGAAAPSLKPTVSPVSSSQPHRRQKSRSPSQAGSPIFSGDYGRPNSPRGIAPTSTGTTSPITTAAAAGAERYAGNGENVSTRSVNRIDPQLQRQCEAAQARAEALARHLVKALGQRQVLQGSVEELESLVEECNAEVGRLQLVVEEQHQDSASALGVQAALRAKEREVAVYEEELRRLGTILEDHATRSGEENRLVNGELQQTIGRKGAEVDAAMAELGMAHLAQRDAEEKVTQLAGELDTAVEQIQYLDERLAEMERAAATARFDRARSPSPPGGTSSSQRLNNTAVRLHGSSSSILNLPSPEETQHWPPEAQRALAELVVQAENLFQQSAEGERHASQRLHHMKTTCDELQQHLRRRGDDVAQAQETCRQLREEKAALQSCGTQLYQRLCDVREDAQIVSEMVRTSRGEAEDVVVAARVAEARARDLHAAAAAASPLRPAMPVPSKVMAMDAEMLNKSAHFAQQVMRDFHAVARFLASLRSLEIGARNGYEILETLARGRSPSPGLFLTADDDTTPDRHRAGPSVRGNEPDAREAQSRVREKKARVLRAVERALSIEPNLEPSPDLQRSESPPPRPTNTASRAAGPNTSKSGARTKAAAEVPAVVLGLPPRAVHPTSAPVPSSHVMELASDGADAFEADDDDVAEEMEAELEVVLVPASEQVRLSSGTARGGSSGVVNSGLRRVVTPTGAATHSFSLHRATPMESLDPSVASSATERQKVNAPTETAAAPASSPPSTFSGQPFCTAVSMGVSVEETKEATPPSVAQITAMASPPPPPPSVSRPLRLSTTPSEPASALRPTSEGRTAALDQASADARQEVDASSITVVSSASVTPRPEVTETVRPAPAVMAALAPRQSSPRPAPPAVSPTATPPGNSRERFGASPYAPVPSLRSPTPLASDRVVEDTLVRLIISPLQQPRPSVSSADEPQPLAVREESPPAHSHSRPKARSTTARPSSTTSEAPEKESNPHAVLNQMRKHVDPRRAISEGSNDDDEVRLVFSELPARGVVQEVLVAEPAAVKAVESQQKLPSPLPKSTSPPPEREKEKRRSRPVVDEDDEPSLQYLDPLPPAPAERNASPLPSRATPTSSIAAAAPVERPMVTPPPADTAASRASPLTPDDITTVPLGAIGLLPSHRPLHQPRRPADSAGSPNLSASGAGFAAPPRLQRSASSVLPAAAPLTGPSAPPSASPVVRASSGSRPPSTDPRAATSQALALSEPQPAALLTRHQEKSGWSSAGPSLQPSAPSTLIEEEASVVSRSATATPLRMDANQVKAAMAAVHTSSTPSFSPGLGLPHAVRADKPAGLGSALSLPADPLPVAPGQTRQLPDRPGRSRSGPEPAPLPTVNVDIPGSNTLGLRRASPQTSASPATSVLSSDAAVRSSSTPVVAEAPSSGTSSPLRQESPTKRRGDTALMENGDLESTEAAARRRDNVQRILERIRMKKEEEQRRSGAGTPRSPSASSQTGTKSGNSSLTGSPI